MVQAILSALIFIPAFVIGMKVIPIYWLVLPVVAIFIKSIFSVGEAVPGGDFRNLDSNQFQSSDKAVKVVALGLVVLAALAFGLGRLVAWLF